MIDPQQSALVLAPMDGITDAPMRALQGEFGAFTYSVSEFLRVSQDPLPARVFRREVPELAAGSQTPTGLPVQIQILGGHPERMAQSALNAVMAGATAIDVNFGCPAPTVNRHDGGASLLKEPCRIREIVRAVRDAVPPDVPVSAKLRLGWDSIETIRETAAMAVEGGASWLTIHARTRVQGYAPPVHWEPIRRVREAHPVPVIANGDIWSLDDFRRCREKTGCMHFMLGRGALACPALPGQVARALGLRCAPSWFEGDWVELFVRLQRWTSQEPDRRTLTRMKQWLCLASQFGGFPSFDQVKRSSSTAELLEHLRALGHAAAA